MSDRPETEAPRSRKEIYERIRASSREEFILAEMIRLGFWEGSAETPGGDRLTSLIQREGELGRELRGLLSERTRLEDRERLLQELRKQRLLESRQKRKETKERRERERRERAEAWRRRCEREIVHLGEGVSAGLGERALDGARLDRFGLPHLAAAAAIAAAMDLDLGELRFLAFGRRVSKITHYQRFLLPKKSGGTRLISAPMPRLKEAQRWILEHVLARVPAHPAAHGFCRGRTITSNAAPHVGADVVVNVDLEDFFPTVTYRRVKGTFRALGYSEEAAIVFALLCTEPETDEVELDGERWWVARGERHLPQGAPSSPALTNILCHRLDRRLSGLTGALGWTYTRYADDLTFSARRPREGGAHRLLRAVEDIVTDESFKIQSKKTRVMHRGRRQEVTGLVVNQKLGVDRRTLRRFRATLYQMERDGPAGKRWNGHVGDAHGGMLIESLRGYAAFVAMVDPQRGRPLVQRVERIVESLRWQPPKRARRPKPETTWKKAREARAGAEKARDAKTAGDAGTRPAGERKKPWWKFW